MRISIIAGTAYPANPNFYGSEVQSSVLANELGKDNEVHLFAASKSMKGNYELHLLPCSWGKLSYKIESLILEYYDILKDSDYVIDAAPLCSFSEETWFFRKKWLKEHVLVYYRNGSSSFNPRPPVNLNLPGVWLSNSAVKAIKPFNLPKDLTYVIPYGIPDWYEPNFGERLDYILYLGAPRPEKGIFTILKVAKELPEQKFILAWRVFSKTHKESEQKFLPLAKDIENVEFRELPAKNHLEAKLKLYQEAKAFIQLISPDYVEAFGLCLAESLKSGCPIITFDRPCHKELFKEIGCFGSNLKEIIQIIKESKFPSPKECHNFIDKNYSVELYGKKFLKLYNKLRK